MSKKILYLGGIKNYMRWVLGKISLEELIELDDKLNEERRKVK